MDSQSACRPFIEGRGDVRVGRRERIESRRVIFHFRDDFSRLNPDADQDLMLAMIGITMRDNVGDRFFQREVKIVEDTRRKLVDRGKFA